MILVKGLQRYQRSKLEVKKNIYQMAGFEPMRTRLAALADTFFVLQLWPLISLQPLDQNQCLIPHLKDLLRICLEDKAQGFWTSFKVCNLGSKYPYINRAYVVRVLLFSFLALKTLGDKISKQSLFQVDSHSFSWKKNPFINYWTSKLGKINEFHIFFQLSFQKE